MRNIHPDKIKLQVDATEKQGAWYQCLCAHPMEAEYLVRSVSEQDVLDALNADGQGNIPYCTEYDDAQGDAQTDERLITLSEWIAEEGEVSFHHLLDTIINRREGRTEWLPKRLKDFAPFAGLDKLLQSIHSNRAA